MKNKKTRLQLIVELVKNNCIGSQDELSRLLAARGFAVTQATLSRDLKSLKITKVATDMGRYMYIIPGGNGVHDVIISKGQNVSRMIASYGSMTLEFSGNFAVIKTRVGYASGVAYDIDMSHMPEVLGTIAGADTVFAVLREDVTHNQAREAFSRFLPIEAPSEE